MLLPRTNGCCELVFCPRLDLVGAPRVIEEPLRREVQRALGFAVHALGVERRRGRLGKRLDLAGVPERGMCLRQLDGDQGGIVGDPKLGQLVANMGECGHRLLGVSEAGGQPPAQPLDPQQVETVA